jgi:hypothetical protein
MGDDGGFNNDGWYPHDGEGKIGSCPGPGCDCDEQNYGHISSGHRKKSNNNNSSGCGVWIAIIVALIIGYGINELLGAIIMIGIIIYIAVCL